MSETVEALVEAGNASAGPPLGPALGPTGVQIPKVVEEINERTTAFEGMEVPVTVTVNDDGSFEIDVGTPPTSAMIRKETGLEALSGHPDTEKLADMAIEQVIKIAESKLSDLNTRRPKSAVKQVAGSCVSSGILIEGKDPREIIQEINEGKYDQKILNWETEISEERRKELEERREKLQEEARKKQERQRERAQEILDEMADAERHEIVTAMEEEDIPKDIIKELLPAKVPEAAEAEEALEGETPAPETAAPEPAAEEEE